MDVDHFAISGHSVYFLRFINDCREHPGMFLLTQEPA